MPDDPLDSLGSINLDDPPPAGTRKRRGRPPGSKNKPKASKALTDTELRRALEEALVFPAVPSMMFYPTVEGKMYLATHFTVAGPWGAEKLIAISKVSPPFRRVLEQIAKTSVAGMFISFLGVYLGGPALFVLGQRGMAESLTASTQADESQMRQMMEAMLSSPGAFAPESQSNGASPAGESGSPQPGTNGAGVEPESGADTAPPLA